MPVPRGMLVFFSDIYLQLWIYSLLFFKKKLIRTFNGKKRPPPQISHPTWHQSAHQRCPSCLSGVTCVRHSPPESYSATAFMTPLTHVRTTAIFVISPKRGYVNESGHLGNLGGIFAKKRLSRPAGIRFSQFEVCGTWDYVVHSCVTSFVV